MGFFNGKSEGAEANAKAQAKARVEAKAGKISTSARYHQAHQVIGQDYNIKYGKVLGTGYNGSVCLATSVSDPHQKFAVKRIKVGDEKMRSEAEIFLSLDHPHIVRLFDVYESGNHLWLVMECMEGGELFDYVMDHPLGHLPEQEAVNAMWQMLLSVNYIHSNGIAHRDLKLENFMYEKKERKHLKLIDFGFSKEWQSARRRQAASSSGGEMNVCKMKTDCGTTRYMAPEVLNRDYTSQCDLWSMGVIAFTLLSGKQPFRGRDRIVLKNIAEGNYDMDSEVWDSISAPARDFVQSLLRVDPEERLTAEQALQHPWLAGRSRLDISARIDTPVVDALRQFGEASKFRRCCYQMMAWSLSNKERAEVRQYFEALDGNKRGTVRRKTFKKVMSGEFNVPVEEADQIFKAMDACNDDEIKYSEFLAAMVSTQITLTDELLKATFLKFDTEETGYITETSLREVVGEKFDGVHVKKLIAETGMGKKKISYPEFASYLRGGDLRGTGTATGAVNEKPGGSFWGRNVKHFVNEACLCVPFLGCPRLS
jgi:calcium-dependent protein kinase